MLSITEIFTISPETPGINYKYLLNAWCFRNEGAVLYFHCS